MNAATIQFSAPAPIGFHMNPQIPIVKFDDGQPRCKRFSFWSGDEYNRYGNSILSGVSLEVKSLLGDRRMADDR
jgi:hypothetical protein